MIRRLYNYLAAALVRTIVAYCTARKRYVDYVHTSGHLVTVDVSPEGLRAAAHSTPIRHVYMRRYVLFGYRTGDPKQTGWRAWVPSLYLHHMMQPDADTALHNHPFPWGLSFVLLGGYVEKRFDGPHPSKNTIQGWLEQASVEQLLRETVTRTHTAPALNWIPGAAFHRVAELDRVRVCRDPRRLCTWSCSGDGTYTLFLAGPRRKNKPWGYLVPGRGYVDQKIRHAELEASEVRP